MTLDKISTSEPITVVDSTLHSSQNFGLISKSSNSSSARGKLLNAPELSKLFIFFYFKLVGAI